MTQQRDMRQASDRIEQLLTELVADGVPGVAHRVDELVRLLAELYGEGLARIMTALTADGVTGAEVVDRLAADDLVASLLVVHGLHPLSIPERVERALEGVRATFADAGGNAELLSVETDTAVVRVTAGSGCGAGHAKIAAAVEEAIAGAAPDVMVEVPPPVVAPGKGALISADSLFQRPVTAGAGN
jgi:Fe-S cluster biogenesis protein NfuA